MAEMRSLVYADCVVGVPYVLAPSEAEAQCAELERLKLVDGTITDDCDVFLFGGRHVFKNIFSDSKYVEWHVMDNIEQVNPSPSRRHPTPPKPRACDI